MDMPSATEASQQVSTEAPSDQKQDPTNRYVTITKDGWLETRIHVASGLYQILGFFREVEDQVRTFYAEMKKRQDEKTALAKPGFRGFNIFRRDSR